jgi:hypothetical protein
MADPLDRLYAASLEDFVSVRNEVAKELKSAGESDRAAEVAKLRKPSVAIWALNQAARRDSKAAKALAQAAVKVADVQARRKSGDLRAAQDALREVASALVDGAEGTLRDAGRSVPDTLGHRLHELIRAVAADPGSREALVAGQLHEEPELGGFSALGAFGSAPAPERPAPKAEKPSKAEEARKRREAERETRLQQLRSEVRDAETAAADARRAADRAERHAAQLRRSLERLEK